MATSKKKKTPKVFRSLNEFKDHYFPDDKRRRLWDEYHRHTREGNKEKAAKVMQKIVDHAKVTLGIDDNSGPRPNMGEEIRDYYPREG
jgi:hypothetical protein